MRGYVVLISFEKNATAEVDIDHYGIVRSAPILLKVHPTFTL